MKTAATFLLAVLAAFASFSAETVNLVVRAVDVGLVPQARVLYTLTPTAPLRRTYGTNVVTATQRSVRADADGVAIFTNTLWGAYNLDIPGNTPTSWRLWITTNYSGNQSVALFVTNSSAMPPNPTANYYVMSQVDALIAGVQAGVVSNAIVNTNGTGYGTTLVSPVGSGVNFTGAFTGPLTGTASVALALSGGLPDANTNLANLTMNGLMSTNLYTRLYSRADYHREANKTIPMGIISPSYGSNVATFDTILGMATCLRTNNMIQHGYNVVGPNCGGFSATRSGGRIRMGPTGSEMNVTNLISALATNGCYLELYFQMRATDNKLDECGSMTVGPSTPYEDGYEIGKWGVREAWMGDMTEFPADGVQLRYMSEAFHAGLYDGATLAGFSYVPATMISSGNFLGNTARWIPEVYNHPYARELNGGDMNTSGIAGWKEAFFYSMRNYSWLLTSASSPTLIGFTIRATGAQGWLTDDYERVIFGNWCLQSMPLFMAGWPPTPNELVIINNDHAIAIDQDQLRAPAIVLSSNATSAVISKQLLNGDVAVALWNLNTNAATAISVSLTTIPGIHTNEIALIDVFDGLLNAATNTLSATVNAGGLNLYRLTPGGALPVTITTAPYVLTSGGRSTNQIAFSPILSDAVVGSNIVYQSVCPTNSITTNLVIWLRADAQTWTEGTATNWLDSSGLGNDATNTANWPVFHTNVVNGLPAFQFTNSAFLVSKYAGGPAYTNYTLVMVYRLLEGSDSCMLFDKAFNFGFALQYNASAGGDFRLNDHYEVLQTTPVAVGSWTTAGAWKRESAFGAWSGSSTNTATDPLINSALSAQQPYIGKYNGGGQLFNGYIAEILYYAGGLSDADLSALMTGYIRPKYFAAWPVVGVPVESSPVASQAYVDSHATGLTSNQVYSIVLTNLGTDGFNTFYSDANYTVISSNAYGMTLKWTNNASLTTNFVNHTAISWTNGVFTFWTNGVAGVIVNPALGLVDALNVNVRTGGQLTLADVAPNQIITSDSAGNLGVASPMTVNNLTNVVIGSGNRITGDGAGLTNLNATQLLSGFVPVERLAHFLSSTNTWTGPNTFTNGLTATGPGTNVLYGETAFATAPGSETVKINTTNGTVTASGALVGGTNVLSNAGSVVGGVGFTNGAIGYGTRAADVANYPATITAKTSINTYSLNAQDLRLYSNPAINFCRGNDIFGQTPECSITEPSTGVLLVSGPLLVGGSLTPTNGVIIPTNSAPPSLAISGAQFFCDNAATNQLCLVVRLGATLVTNRVQLLPYP